MTYDLEQILELDVGARLPIIDRGSVRPWIGAGGAIAYAEYSTSGFFDDGSDADASHRQGAEGIWVACGADFHIFRAIVGVQIHHSTAELVDDAPIDLGGTSLELAIGLTF